MTAPHMIRTHGQRNLNIFFVQRYLAKRNWVATAILLLAYLIIARLNADEFHLDHFNSQVLIKGIHAVSEDEVQFITSDGLLRVAWQTLTTEWQERLAPLRSGRGTSPVEHAEDQFPKKLSGEFLEKSEKGILIRSGSNFYLIIKYPYSRKLIAGDAIRPFWAIKSSAATVDRSKSPEQWASVVEYVVSSD